MTTRWQITSGNTSMLLSRTKVDPDAVLWEDVSDDLDVFDRVVRRVEEETGDHGIPLLCKRGWRLIYDDAATIIALIE